ncbi:sensor histidine kinase, partial [Azospirillum sp. TSA6c]
SAVERLDRMAEIHEKLYRTQGLQEIEFGGYLRMLCRDLLASFEPAQSLHVVLDVDADEVFLKPDRAIPLALIANEAMINALKYAFPDGRSGRIAVSFREISYEVLRMSISDDGIGMAEKRRTGSLGLTLMELLAEQVKGGLTVGSGAGTTVTVSIPA